MKAIGILIAIILGSLRFATAQYYEPTGKVSVWNISTSPVASFRSKGLPMNYSNASVQYGRLWHKGIYYTLGYTYHQNNGIVKVDERTDKYKLPAFQSGHGVNASIELKKLLFTSGGNTHSVLRCFYKNIGISIAPEYQYLFPVKGIVNTSKGEFSLRTGLYYHQGHTKMHKHTNWMYAIYYKKAFTPLMVVESPVGKQSYMYDEVGVRVTILLKKLMRFDNFERK